MRIPKRRGTTATVWLVVLLLSLLAAATASARPGVGSAESPVMLSVADGVDAALVGEMAVALEIATGLHFEVETVAFGQAGVDWLCDDFPDRGLRIMPSIEYVFAKNDCSAATSMTLRRFNQDGARGEFLVPADSGLSELSDLAGLDWFYSGEGSLTGYLAPLHMLNEAGVEGYTETPVGTHIAAVAKVYDNAVDPDNPDPVFATVFVDARSDDQKEHVVVLEETPYMPFPAAAFGPRFDDDLRAEIESLLRGFSHEAHPAHWVWENSLGAAYASDGWVKANWRDFHFLKDVLEDTGFTF